MMNYEFTEEDIPELVDRYKEALDWIEDNFAGRNFPQVLVDGIRFFSLYTKDQS